MSHHQISPWRAILLSVNVMVGGGVFVNLPTLAKLAGPWGFLGYFFGALILLPVIISLATLASLHAVAGGLFVYGKEYLHPIAGFISSWAYFLGKCVTVAIFANAFVLPFYASHLGMQVVPQLLWTAGLLLLLIALNNLGVHLGGRIQWLFAAIKLLPVFAVIVSGIIRGGWSSGSLWSSYGAPAVAPLIPVALFALSGFEIICTLGHQIQDPRKNALRIVLGSSLFVMVLYVLFQISAFILAGAGLQEVNCLAVLGSSLPVPFKAMGFLLDDVVYAVLFSAVFNVLINNAWNLYAIARERFFLGSSFITRCSSIGVPWVAQLIAATLSVIILAITTDFIALQNMSVLGTVMAYFISTLAALVAFSRNKVLSWIIPLIGLGSCFYVLGLCLQRLVASGLSTPFMVLFLLGLAMAVSQFVVAKIVRRQS